jgi:hypothetical protein
MENTAAQEDGYVTGIEPATGYPFNRKSNGNMVAFP